MVPFDLILFLFLRKKKRSQVSPKRLIMMSFEALEASISGWVFKASLSLSLCFFPSHADYYQLISTWWSSFCWCWGCLWLCYTLSPCVFMKVHVNLPQMQPTPRACDLWNKKDWNQLSVQGHNRRMLWWHCQDDIFLRIPLHGSVQPHSAFPSLLGGFMTKK